METMSKKMRTVRQVWAWNLRDELPQILSAGELTPYVALDTEFTGFLHQTARSASPDERYHDLKANVDALKLVQVGLTFFGGGFDRITWQINLRTRRSTKGVDPELLSLLLLQSGWVGGEETGRSTRVPRWVTFHGMYDVAYLVKLLTGGRPLPETLSDFAQLVGEMLGVVYDIKYMARFYRGLHGGELGLVRLAEILDVEVGGGRPHQAGYDSLLTGLAFEKMRDRRCLPEELIEGVLYGFEQERFRPQRTEETVGVCTTIITPCPILAVVPCQVLTCPPPLFHCRQQPGYVGVFHSFVMPPGFIV